MEKVKPWQWVLLAVALSVFAFGLWYSFKGETVKRASQFYMVDVATGEFYSADISGRRSVTVPAKNAETGERTLLPIRMEESGVWVIEAKFRGIADEITQIVGVAPQIDPSTWEVEGDVSTARRYRRP